MYILLSSILLFVLCSPAFAQDAGAVAQNLAWLGDNLRSLSSHTLMTIGGVGLAIGLAAQAFGRRQVNVANVPTFPRYMTSPQQCRFGSIVFIIFASGFFLLLVYEHKEVARVADLFGEGLAKNIIDAIKDDAAPYLLVVAAMSAVYLYCLKKEANWNPLLMMRDAIHTWISIPQLAGEIVEKIQFSLTVPPAAIAEVIRNSEVVAADFAKGETTPERIWAETCYMKWWLTQGQRAGQDGIFFTEPSFSFEELLRQFDKASTRMHAWKAGQPVEVDELVDKIKELHNKFSRLVACYLVYRNASHEALDAEARRFGIEPTIHAAGENPIKYWIVYALALVASVYVGVYACGIVYDWMTGAGFVADQDFERIQSWILYSLSNFGVAISAILALRVASPYLGLGVHQTHLLTYCWTFIVAFLTGPFGLAMAAHFFGPAKYQAMPLLEAYFHTLKWGIGPALVGVYISYYLDRQTCPDLPNINHSYSTIGWRLLNCIGFAAITLFLLLPPLLALKAESDAAWDTSKLRFVATSTMFFIAFGLALAAQFALRKGTQEASPVLTPRTS
jgi:hypothetical protein